MKAIIRRWTPALFSDDIKRKLGVTERQVRRRLNQIQRVLHFKTFSIFLKLYIASLKKLLSLLFFFCIFKNIIGVENFSVIIFTFL